MAMGSLPYISLFTCPNNKHSYPFLFSFSNQWISCSYLLTIFRDFFHLWVIVNLTIPILRALILFSYVLKIPSPGCGLSFNVVHRVYFIVEKFSSFNFFFSLEDLVKNILFKKKIIFQVIFFFYFCLYIFKPSSWQFVYTMHLKCFFFHMVNIMPSTIYWICWLAILSVIWKVIRHTWVCMCGYASWLFPSEGVFCLPLYQYTHRCYCFIWV